MKLKADVSAGLTLELALAFEGVRDLVAEEIILPHLHSDFRQDPAAFFVQFTDLCASSKAGETVIWVLSQVSRGDHRCEDDFRRTRTALQELASKLIEENVPIGTRAQLFVVVQVDGAEPARGWQGLIESDYIWVDGQSRREFTPIPRKQVLSAQTTGSNTPGRRQ